MKGKKSVDIEKGSPTQGGIVLSPVHEECNPKVKNERRIVNSSPPICKKRNLEATSARGIGRGSKEKGGIEEVAAPATVKHEETAKATVRRGGTASTVGRNAKREESKAEPKSKLQALNEEPGTVKHEETTEAIVRGRGTASTVGRNAKREGSKAEPKNKLQALNKEPRIMKHEETIETTVREMRYGEHSREKREKRRE